MNHLTLFLSAILWLSSCSDNTSTEKVDSTVQNRIVSTTLVSETTSPKNWPYRYRLTLQEGKWSGEVDLNQNGKFTPFDTFKITDQSPDNIAFQAAYGGPGKALPADWNLSLKKINDHHYQGRLTSSIFDSMSVELKFTPMTNKSE